VLHLSWWWGGNCLSLSLELSVVDGIDMECQVLTPTGPNPPLSTLGGATEKCLGHLMVVELSRRVVQHRVIIKTFIGEREMLYPFHGEEQQENT
jgi:hypothetical protein